MSFGDVLSLITLIVVLIIATMMGIQLTRGVPSRHDLNEIREELKNSQTRMDDVFNTVIEILNKRQ